MPALAQASAAAGVIVSGLASRVISPALTVKHSLRAPKIFQAHEGQEATVFLPRNTPCRPQPFLPCLFRRRGFQHSALEHPLEMVPNQNRNRRILIGKREYGYTVLRGFLAGIPECLADWALHSHGRTGAAKHLGFELGFF